MANILQDNPVIRYFRETWAELKKVRWPTRQETQNLTLIVLAVTVGMAIILGTMDYLFLIEFQGLVGGSPVSLVIAGVGLLAGIAVIILGMREQ